MLFRIPRKARKLNAHNAPVMQTAYQAVNLTPMDSERLILVPGDCIRFHVQCESAFVCALYRLWCAEMKQMRRDYCPQCLQNLTRPLQSTPAGELHVQYAASGIQGGGTQFQSGGFLAQRGKRDALR